MSIYKKFSKSDISITPFTAHTQNTLTSSSLSSIGGRYYSSSFPTVAYRNGKTSTFRWAKTGSYIYSSFGGGLKTYNDPNNHKQYFQLDHLFYKNSKIDYINKFNTIEYFDHYRVLHDKVNILSLPYKTIGYKIHSGSFSLTTGSISLKDDNKGHIYDTQFNLGDLNFKNEKFRVFNLGPQEGYKAYNLNTKNGYEIINSNSTYSSGRIGILDDSFFFNKLTYKNTTFSSKNIGGGDYPVINFDESFISSPHNSKYNFNSDDNFAISFFISSSEIPDNNLKKYLISKSTIKKIITDPNTNASTNTSGSSQIIDAPAEVQYPFEIYYQSQSIHFDRFDGTTISSVSTIATSSNTSMIHVTCQKSSSNLELYVNGYKLATSTDNTTLTQNTADLFIGNKGGASGANFYTGSMAQIMIFDDALSQTQINNLSQSIDNKPYIGNIFYNNGLITITKPNYQDILNPGIGNQDFILQYQGTHLIYENEYQCMVEQHEYDYTLNPSARKNKHYLNPELANFTTGSNFRPYVTTIGLYNENNELLAVGKLGQAIRMNDETDMTFVVRYDT